MVNCWIFWCQCSGSWSLLFCEHERLVVDLWWWYLFLYYYWYCWICWKIFSVIYSEVHYWYCVFTWPVISGSLSPQHGESIGCAWRNSFQYRGYCEYINKQSWTANKGWSSSLGFEQGANNSSLWTCILLRNIHAMSFEPGLVLWYDLISKTQLKRV
jgi:hypothetical protein